MKKNKFFVKKYLVSSVLLVASFALGDNKWTGNGDGSSWTDVANWDQTYTPGSVSAPTSDGVYVAGANNGTTVVNLDADLPTITHDLRFDASYNVSTTIVNIASGASVSATYLNNTLLTIQEGGSNNGQALSALNVAGSLTVGQVRMARDSGTSRLLISNGGLVTMTGGGHFEMRPDQVNSRAVFEMTGGRFTSDGNRELLMGTIDSQVLLSGSAVMDGSDLSLRMDHGVNAGSSDLLTLSGSSVNATFANANIFQLDTTTDSSAEIKFISDAEDVSTLTVADLFDLDGDGIDDTAGDLVVDLSAYDGATDGSVVLDLVSYGELQGTFDNVTVIGGEGVIDYGSGDNGIITMRVIPEPATIGLVGAVGFLAFIIRRFRM